MLSWIHECYMYYTNVYGVMGITEKYLLKAWGIHKIKCKHGHDNEKCKVWNWIQILWVMMFKMI